MGGQKAKIRNNALITQFFKKTPPPPPPTPALAQRHNDENALTESEIADQNRRAMQRGGLAKKKKPVFRHALAQVVHEEGNDMRRVVLGGLKNMDNAPRPTRREPGFSVLSDNTDGSDPALRTPMMEKTVAMPKGWNCDGEPSAVAAAAPDKNAKTMNRFQKALLKKRECVSNADEEKPTRPERKPYNDATTAAADQGETRPAVEAEEKPPPADDNDSKAGETIPKKRPVEDELLITTTRRKVLGPKPQIRQQQKHKEEVMPRKEYSPKIPNPPSFFDDNESESGSPYDEAQLSPLEFSISDSVSFPPAPRNHPSSPSPEESPDNLSTIALTHPEHYEEHPAFPVPRGKSLVEKLGIKEAKEQPTENEEEEEEEEKDTSSLTSSPASYTF